MLWIAAPVVLIAGATALLAAIRSVESARRELAGNVAALGATRLTLEPVQRHISATCTTAVSLDRR